MRRNSDNEITQSDAPGPADPITREEAVRQLQLWREFSEPSEQWIRKTLVRTGAAAPQDGVSATYMEITTVPQHERAALALMRRVAAIAGAHVTVLKFTALCGRGAIEKRIARVVFSEGGTRILRLDMENRTVRDMLESSSR
jgi:hypothetical protein